MLENNLSVPANQLTNLGEPKQESPPSSNNSTNWELNASVPVTPQNIKEEKNLETEVCSTGFSKSLRRTRTYDLLMVPAGRT